MYSPIKSEELARIFNCIFKMKTDGRVSLIADEGRNMNSELISGLVSDEGRWLIGCVSFYYDTLGELKGFDKICTLIKQFKPAEFVEKCETEGVTAMRLVDGNFIIKIKRNDSSTMLLSMVKKGELINTTILRIVKPVTDKVIPSQIIDKYVHPDIDWDICLFYPETLPLVFRKTPGHYTGFSWKRDDIKKKDFIRLIDALVKLPFHNEGIDYLEFSSRTYRQIRFGLNTNKKLKLTPIVKHFSKGKDSWKGSIHVHKGWNEEGKVSDIKSL